MHPSPPNRRAPLPPGDVLTDLWALPAPQMQRNGPHVRRPGALHWAVLCGPVSTVICGLAQWTRALKMQLRPLGCSVPPTVYRTIYGPPLYSRSCGLSTGLTWPEGLCHRPPPPAPPSAPVPDVARRRAGHSPDAPDAATQRRAVAHGGEGLPLCCWGLCAPTPSVRALPPPPPHTRSPIAGGGWGQTGVGGGPPPSQPLPLCECGG